MIEMNKTIDLMLAINRLELAGAEFVERFGLSTIGREYNGIGPEFFPSSLRAKVTKFLSLFEPAAVIHDLRNYCSDGTTVSFHAANKEFLDNCRACVTDRYSWWDLRRYRGYAVAKLLFDFVDGHAGWRAWMDCYEKKQQNKGTQQ